MSKYLIRFNQTRGQPGRGTIDHVWRVFEDSNEILCKNIKINVPAWSEQSPEGGTWNIACEGVAHKDKETSTITINKE